MIAEIIGTGIGDDGKLTNVGSGVIPPQQHNRIVKAVRQIAVPFEEARMGSPKTDDRPKLQGLIKFIPKSLAIRNSAGFMMPIAAGIVSYRYF